MFLARFLGYFLIVFTLQGFANPGDTSPEQKADEYITQLYYNLNALPTTSMSDRITLISAKFLYKPYLRTALGEGHLGDFDQWPLYRIDAFDCETYVDMVLALALAKDLPSFKEMIRQIRYSNGKPSFVTRNHFTDLDWNLNNQRKGFVQDITMTFHDPHNKPIAKIATAKINKSAWYNHFTIAILRPQKPIPSNEQEILLNELKKQGRKLPTVMSTIPYIPFTALFNEEGKPNAFLFSQIPNAAIIEIVRPNWDLQKKIGTCLNVSHLGFAIWKNGTIFFREASLEDKVIDVPLIDYLRNASKDSSIQGINVQVVPIQSAH